MKIFVITKKMLIIAAAVIFVAVVFRWSRFANVRHGTA